MIYRKWVFIVIFISSCLCAFAQRDKKIAFAYGLEINKYAVDGFAGGVLLGFDFNLPHRFAAGVSLAGNTGGYGNGVLEPSALLRYYFTDDHSGFFMQADLGTAIMNEIGKNTPANDDGFAIKFMGGIRGGYRLIFLKMWYIEPYIRAGYPFLLGTGILMGYRF